MSDVLKEAVSKLSKDVYDDGLKKSVIPAGNILSLIPRSIDAALSQYDIWLTKKELNTAMTKKLIAEKLINADPDKIVKPEAYVAIPAAQAIAYSMGSDELCNMYANLLAKSMYIDTKEEVHPSFVEIIKQLSPLDAKLFAIIKKDLTLPLLDIHIVDTDNTEGSFKKIATNITGMDELGDAMIISASIINLEKQGLIKTSDDFIIEANYYQKILESKEYQSILSEPIHIKGHYKPVKRLLRITDLGIIFGFVCIDNSLTE